ncbi:hypothetical protein ONS95_012869 [Cadophora gregata]|uniref:uncharacterized protein n=1 Tax=Cadophora gregata TaxID=51156 RepID=UPI0026DD6417|nr:uncharacterized protein ONS95_012869 [Cadophora gregata]KAK0101150.1 hypothetical protein ONS96_006374 [Cadophora gregata f. sp. sojae]KAK0115818.1 hypothetical protein ONS95_012869 [Cadophora gregata]
MESFKGSHRYQRLRGSDIRVVRFKPCPPGSNDNARIEGYISHVPLLGSDFFALSYVWGDASDTKTITLDGQDFPITTNLWDAIKSLRNRYDAERKPQDKNVPEILRGEIDETGDGWKNSAICWWIDAICIDQTSTKERSRQVPRMKSLYSTATRVVVWWRNGWGDVASEGSELDINMLFQAGEKLHDAAPWSTSACRFSDTSQSTRVDILTKTFDAPEKLIRTLAFVIRSGWDWMSRVWTLQEAVLPREDPALIMGEEVTGLWILMELQECFAAASRRGIFLRHLIAGNQETLINRILYDMYLLSEKVSDRPITAQNHALSSRAKIFGGLSYQASALRSRMASSKRHSPPLSATLTRFGEALLDCVVFFSDRRATTPHDRIYGLLGLVEIPHLPTYLRPDYKRPFAEVCFAYVKFLIKASGSLYILALGTNRFEGYPTWVSDFSESLQGESGATPVTPVFSEDERCISVPGVKLGEVVAIHCDHERCFAPNGDDPNEILSMFFDLARTIMLPASKIRSCDVGEILKEWAENISAKKPPRNGILKLWHVSLLYEPTFSSPRMSCLTTASCATGPTLIL